MPPNLVGSRVRTVSIGEGMRFLAGRRSLAWALVFAATAQLGLLLTPYLVDRVPLVLLALRPQPEFVLLLAGLTPAVAIIAVVAPLRWLLHMVYVEVGRWAGDAVLVRTRLGRWLLPRLAQRRVSQLLLLSCLVHLGTPVDLALGAGRVGRLSVAFVLGVGSLVSTALFVTVGQQLAPVTGAALRWVIENRPLATFICATFALVGLVAARRLLSAGTGGQRTGRS